MAKTKQQQQQLLVIYLTICLVVVSLLMKVDSVSASSIPLDGSGNMLQQLQPPQIENDVREHSYITDQANHYPTAMLMKNPNMLEVNGDNTLKEKSLSEDLASFGHSFKPIGVAKRAPGGFLGMRGKKLYNDDNSNTENDHNTYSYNLPWNQLQSSDEDINWDEYGKTNVRRYKKAPTAFYGVRGKKFTTMNGGSSNSDSPRWEDFLQKLEEERVRDAILQDFVERLAGTKTDVANDMAKRAPTGFTGVRGKRPSSDELDSSMETLTKRGLGNNAFVGVRGKKDVSHQTFKRSPVAAERYFFGFWKKSSPGRNGKRQRFVDFNNKFVAVRGKKSSLYDISELNGLNNNESPLTSMRLLYDKRAPKGFLGMRGKRPFTTDNI